MGGGLHKKDGLWGEGFIKGMVFLGGVLHKRATTVQTITGPCIFIKSKHLLQKLIVRYIFNLITGNNDVKISIFL